MTIDATLPASGDRPRRRFPSLDLPAIKLVLLTLLALLMLIPLGMVEGINDDRMAHQAEAQREYAKSWGPAQSVVGPILIVPYRLAYWQPRQYLHIAPYNLTANATLQPEVRRRGLFRAVVYRAQVALSGQFKIPREALPTNPEAQVIWDDAMVVVGASDLRELGPDAAFSWGDKGDRFALTEAPADGDGSCGEHTLLAFKPHLTEAPSPDTAIPFSGLLPLRGTRQFALVPMGRQVGLSVSAPWQTPSFDGIAPPSTYEINDSGFTASWSVMSNAANGRWVWSAPKTPSCANGANAAVNPDDQIGVELLEAVPIYHMVERASKYAVLFLTLSFLTYFLFETIARIRIHIVQYGLLGLSITLFGLLLVSFSEPLGFTPAYMLSSLLILLQATIFTGSVTRQFRLAALFGAILAALFGFLYVVLSLEVYALLAGAVALFAALSLVMAVTRRVDWSAAGRSAAAG
jgi:inner membrane protein